MNPVTRREALWRLSSASSVLLLGATPGRAAEVAPRQTRMGLVTYAFGIHQKNKWAGRHEGLVPALALLEEAHRLGAAGIQVEIGATPADATMATELRRRAESYQMYLEATFSPPKGTEDVERFGGAVRNAQAAGATLARGVIMPGRRYEEFKSLDQFRAAQQAGRHSLELAAPILAKNNFKFAIENHKDERIEEKIETLRRVGSEHIGLCVDVGNSFTLLEDPLEVARAYAPYAFTAHFKDQAVRPAPDGFWFADVALGQGFLDLPSLVSTLHQAKPGLHLNLEVITRDPLRVPVLTEDFWVTLPEVPARALARTLNTVRAHASPTAFQMISSLSPDQQMAAELANVERSFAFARDRLGLA
jgi:sugar phosphate isomerase/epimerase